MTSVCSFLAHVIPLCFTSRLPFKEQSERLLTKYGPRASVYQVYTPSLKQELYPTRLATIARIGLNCVPI